MSDAVIVLTTWPAEGAAAEVAQTLVTERLAACVNVLGEMQSTYRWQGSLEVDRERQLVIKTTRTRLAALEGRLAALHPYQLPEFLVLSVEAGSASYLAWLRESTGEP